MQFSKLNVLGVLFTISAVASICLATNFDYDFNPYADDDSLVELSNGPEYRYQAGFPEPATLAKLGEVSGVSALNETHIYVFHRADRKWEENDYDLNNVFTKQERGPIKKPTIALIVDGKIVKEFGENLFFMPHSITVDEQGNIWTTDTALHQVFKFNKDDLSKPSLILGERFKPGNDEKHFCKPTDVKVASNGDFFVSDGYCNSRVLKFKSNGTLITYWGHKVSNVAGRYSLSLPHGLALHESLDIVLVADRVNQRIVAYSAGLGENSNCGEYLNQWELPEPVYAVDVNALTGEIYALVGETTGSSVKVLDLESSYILQSIVGQEHSGFGMGHALSTLKGSAGFVVGSLVPKCALGVPCALSPSMKKNPLRGGLFLYEMA